MQCLTRKENEPPFVGGAVLLLRSTWHLGSLTLGRLSKKADYRVSDNRPFNFWKRRGAMGATFFGD
jgi:hypothetical protein